MDAIESELQSIYDKRFGGAEVYRNQVWKHLCLHFFQRFIPADSRVLDLGCGFGEFSNNIVAKEKLAMDLNPQSPKYLSSDIHFLHQDCSAEWTIGDESLDIVFTSNFFEHLPSKSILGLTLDQAAKKLRPGGLLIAMGPNIKFIPGAYWDFWDHYLPLTELSLAEGLSYRPFRVTTCIDRFLPYTMVGVPRTPPAMVRAYLKMPWIWPIFGKQFLVVAERH